MSINLLSISTTMTVFTVLMCVFIALVLIAACLYYKLHLQKRGVKEEKSEDVKSDDSSAKTAVKDEKSDDKNSECAKKDEKAERTAVTDEEAEAEEVKPVSEAKEESENKHVPQMKRGKKKKTPKFVIVEDKTETKAENKGEQE